MGILTRTTDLQIGADLILNNIGIWQEQIGKSAKTPDYGQVNAVGIVERKRQHVQTHKMETKPALASPAQIEWSRSRPPWLFDDLLYLEAMDASVKTITESPNAGVRTVFDDTTYRWNHARPNGELAAPGTCSNPNGRKANAIGHFAHGMDGAASS